MYEPTNWEEWFSETFPEFTPESLETLAYEAGMREAEMLITESDMELGEPDWHQQIADWDAFLLIKSELEGDQ